MHFNFLENDGRLRHLAAGFHGRGELDYLAKRLESFDRYELAQFQGTSVSQDYFNMTDSINLTFCCQGVTVVQNLTDLTAVPLPLQIKGLRAKTLG